jgi:CheY-specific phosphatase CheX
MIALAEGLQEAALAAFETLCFMFPAPELAEAWEAAELQLTVAVDFEGACRGRLVLALRGDLPIAIAANMLGEDGCSLSQQQDAVKEMGNVICGNALPRLFGTRAVFRLHAPRVVEEEETATPDARVEVSLDEGAVTLLLYVEGGPPPGETA